MIVITRNWLTMIANMMYILRYRIAKGYKCMTPNPMRSLLRFIRLIPMIVGFACVSCEPSTAKYLAVIAQGRSTNKYLHEMDTLYPDMIHYITYFDMLGADKIWNAESYIYGRYILTCQMNVALSSDNSTIISWGKPKFYLWEATSIEKLPSGQWQLHYGRGLEFGGDECDKLSQNGGDFSRIGFKIIKDSPVPNFKEYADEQRTLHPR